jgi:hypothetical protein
MSSHGKQSNSAEQVPVSAYGGSSKNLKDLKDLRKGVSLGYAGLTLGPLGFEGAQHRQTLRPSVDGVRSTALHPFGVQKRISRIHLKPKGPKMGSRVILQNRFRCPPLLGARRTFLGPLGFERAQHRRTPRPSVDGAVPKVQSAPDLSRPSSYTASTVRRRVRCDRLHTA